MGNLLALLASISSHQELMAVSAFLPKHKTHHASPTDIMEYPPNDCATSHFDNDSANISANAGELFNNIQQYAIPGTMK